MTVIEFDEESYKTKAFEGYFPTREALIAACTKQDTLSEKYRAWALKHGVDPDSGSIVISAFNPVQQQVRRERLASQMANFVAGTLPDSDVVHSDLLAAFGKASNKIRTLTITTASNLYPQLRNAFPNLNMGFFMASYSEEHAALSNEIVERSAPEHSTNLVHLANWQNMQDIDVAHIDSAAIYEETPGVKSMLRAVAQTKPKDVVINNLLPRKNEGEEGRHRGQRHSGGIIPAQTFSEGEIAGYMKELGYRLKNQTRAKPTYIIRNPQSAFLQEYPELDHYWFELAA
jgi:hypothetical protein